MTVTFKTIALIAAFTASVCAANAQDKEKVRPSREKVAEMQAQHIAADLALDDVTAKRLVETYCSYQKELWAINPRQSKEQRKTAKTATDKEIEEQITAQFEHSQKILDLRKSYFKKYRAFLTARQIQRMYHIEKKMMNNLSKRADMKGKKNRKPLKRK